MADGYPDVVVENKGSFETLTPARLYLGGFRYCDDRLPDDGRLNMLDHFGREDDLAMSDEPGMSYGEAAAVLLLERIIDRSAAQQYLATFTESYVDDLTEEVEIRRPD